jgi:hypothetical protein
MVDHARLLDLAQHLLRRQQGAVDVGCRQHDRELVAAQSGDGVHAAQQPAHARRDTLQHVIAGLMSERVVDLLEPVEIQQQQRERGVRAAGDPQRLRQTVLEQQPVGRSVKAS